MNFSEISRTPEVLRKKFWLEDLQLPIQWVDPGSESFESPEEFMKNSNLKALLIDPEFSDLVLPRTPRVPAEVVESGLADAMILDHGKVWLRCFLREALKFLILQKAPSLDTHSTCYITGSGSMARMCAVVAIQMGFARLTVISNNYEEGLRFSEDLHKLFFGLKIENLLETELTLQPNNGSLLLNTFTQETGREIFEDLTYLNFLKKDGLVVDLPLSFEMNPLREEANHVGIRLLDGVEIWGTRDFLFLKFNLQDALPVSAGEYLQRWQKVSLSEKQT